MPKPLSLLNLKLARVRVSASSLDVHLVNYFPMSPMSSHIDHIYSLILSDPDHKP
jgi:hypothetical protein